MEEKFIYEVSPLVPPSKSIYIWNVFMRLDSDFAKKARNTPLDEKVHKRLQEMGQLLIGGFFNTKEDDLIRPAYSFMENSLLLHYTQVPGDACDLGLDYTCQNDFFNEGWEKLKKGELLSRISVNYTPHNVDTSTQAFCLMSLWLQWANTAKVITDL